MEYKNYNDIPKYRRSGVASVLLLTYFLTPIISLYAFFILPITYGIVLFALITGDIFYNKKDENGNLKKWSKANKVVAWILFFIVA